MKIEIDLSDYQVNVLCAAGELGNSPSAEAVAGAFLNCVMFDDRFSRIISDMADEYGVEYPSDEDDEAEGNS